MPRADSNGDLLIQSQACCQLHHEAWWACEELNPLVSRTPGLRPGADPTLQHARNGLGGNCTLISGMRRRRPPVGRQARWNPNRRRPAELNRVRLVFSEPCDRHTRAANKVGCLGWSRTTVSTFRASRPAARRQGSGASDGTRTRYGRRDKPVPRRLWLRRLAGRGGIAPPTPDLETGVMLISPAA